MTAGDGRTTSTLHDKVDQLRLDLARLPQEIEDRIEARFVARAVYDLQIGEMQKDLDALATNVRRGDEKRVRSRNLVLYSGLIPGVLATASIVIGVVLR